MLPMTLMLVDRLDQQTKWTTPLEKLIVFGELGDKEKAKREFERLISETTRNPGFLETVKECVKKVRVNIKLHTTMAIKHMLYCRFFKVCAIKFRQQRGENNND
jgi:hypothetical protein